MISILIILLLVLLLLISYKLYTRRKLKKSPPGPLSLPLIENVLSFGKVPHLTHSKCTEQFEKLCEVCISTERQVVPSHVVLLKKAFQHPSLQDRPRIIEVAEYDGKCHVPQGMDLTNGKEWQEQRRFTLRHLRDFGSRKNYIQTLIGEEIFTGKRFGHYDPKLEAIFDLVTMARGANPVVLLFLPRLAKLFPNLSGWNKFGGVFVNSYELVMESIKKHRVGFTKELQENPLDFIESYLNKIPKTDGRTSSIPAVLEDKSLAAVAVELLRAGSITTSTSLEWAVLFLVLHTDRQKNLQVEIDDLFGGSRQPWLSDRPRMTFAEVVTCEIIKKSSAFPVGEIHIATKDVLFEGFSIHTTIVPNVFYVHHNSEIWGDPENFQPERFIDPQGKIQMKEYFIPFSTGKRVFVGETLVRDELFPFIERLLFQRFEIRADPSKPISSMAPVPVA